ncbi:MAG: hypothetical protein ACJAYU_001546 [Bradymonadia bacterium]|jgi:hypothetical protein
MSVVLPDPPAANPVVAAAFQSTGDDSAAVWAIVRGEGPASGLQVTESVDERGPSAPLALDTATVAQVIQAFDGPAESEEGGHEVGEFALDGLGASIFIDGDFSDDIGPGVRDMEWTADARRTSMIEAVVQGDFELMAEAGLVPGVGEEPATGSLDGGIVTLSETMRHTGEERVFEASV